MWGVLNKVALGSAPDQREVLFVVLGHVQAPYLLQRLRRWRPLRQLQAPALHPPRML